ncbi:hypothetical protein [Pseudomonas sp. TH31]|uniref:hypothetical protein n=1 Tax=Pseudomonas sp. TH31 TaxID=2796396 RepID=UPI0019124320|nr:hypothetical protein [Pseudomonas sp. TH31]MBK5415528.1 hypothetical protein [Pseudomonas sp. TH31]
MPALDSFSVKTVCHAFAQASPRSRPSSDPSIDPERIRLLQPLATLLPLTDVLKPLPDYYSTLRYLTVRKRADFVLEGRKGDAKPQQHHCEEATTHAV